MVFRRSGDVPTILLPSADVSHTTLNMPVRLGSGMDSERSIATRSAGQSTQVPGSRFFTAMERTFKPTNGQNATPAHVPRESGSGLRPHRRSADGDGR